MYEIKESDINYCDALCHKFHWEFGGRPDEDNIQDCRESMCIAAKTYDPTLTPYFFTYARWRILWAVKRNYIRYSKKGYTMSGDVYYMKLVGGGGARRDNQINRRGLVHEYENFDLTNRLVATMPERVETALKRHAEGEMFTDIIKDIGYNTRQALAQKIDRWRDKQGIGTKILWA